MSIIKQFHEILTSRESIMEQCRIMELAGRTCYKSENRITENSHIAFLKGIIKSGHESVIEHSAVSVRLITNRAMSHQLVRHRLCSFSQESMRFCNYTKEKFGNELVFIEPLGFNDWSNSLQVHWKASLDILEFAYRNSIKGGLKAEEARGILPQDTKTEIVITANFRQWRHIFRERVLNRHAQPQMRSLMQGVFNEMKAIVPYLFEDLLQEKGEQNDE